MIKEVHSDSAVKNISEDLLGRGDFARDLAKTLVEANLQPGFTTGLYGSWGSGKTSLLYMIKSELEKDYKDKCKIINFSPWLCDSSEQMIEQFFCQLADLFNEKEGTKGLKDSITKFYKSLRSSFVNATIDTLSRITDLPNIHNIFDFLKNFASEINKIDKAKEPLMTQKNNIFNELEKQKQRIIVFIDDIDRLSNDEIVEIFRLVKSLADFPNVVYVLAFDRGIVSKALEKVQYIDGNGQGYLEKIIQYPIDIPSINSKTLNSIFQKLLYRELFTEEIISDDDHKRYLTITNLVYKIFIKNIRDIKRFCNVISVKNRLLKDEVNKGDLVGITAIQLYVPDCFHNIEQFKDEICYKPEEIQITLSNEEANDIISKLNQYINPNYQKKFNNLVSLLFPILRLNNNYIKSSLNSNHICHSECFTRYFILGLEDDDVSNVLLRAMFNDNSSDNEIETIVKNVLKKLKFTKYIEYILEFFINANKDVSSNALYQFNAITSILKQDYMGIRSGEIDKELLSIVAHTSVILLFHIKKEERKLAIHNYISSMPFDYVIELFNKSKIAPELKISEIAEAKLFSEIELQSICMTIINLFENVLSDDQLIETIQTTNFILRIDNIFIQRIKNRLSVIVESHVKTNEAANYIINQYVYTYRTLTSWKFSIYECFGEGLLISEDEAFEDLRKQFLKIRTVNISDIDYLELRLAIVLYFIESKNSIETYTDFTDLLSKIKEKTKINMNDINEEEAKQIWQLVKERYENEEKLLPISN